MEQYNRFILELYQEQLKYGKTSEKFASIYSFYESYMEQRNSFEEDICEILENYFILASCFKEKNLLLKILNDMPFDLTEQRMKVIGLLVKDGELSDETFEEMKKKLAEKCISIYDFFYDFQKLCEIFFNYCNIKSKIDKILHRNVRE